MRQRQPDACNCISSLHWRSSRGQGFRNESERGWRGHGRKASSSDGHDAASTLRGSLRSQDCPRGKRHGDSVSLAPRFSVWPKNPRKPSAEILEKLGCPDCHSGWPGIRCFDGGAIQASVFLR